jgi:hypothetical protein
MLMAKKKSSVFCSRSSDCPGPSSSLPALPQRVATPFTTAGALNDRLSDKHVIRLVQHPPLTFRVNPIKAAGL